MWLKRAVAICLLVTGVVMIAVIGYGLIFAKHPAEVANITNSDPNTAAGQLSNVDQPQSTAATTGNIPSPGNAATAVPQTGAATPKTGTGGGTGGANRPTVTLAISSGSITAGASATLSWTSTNSPTTCSASGDWTGTKASSGSQSTGTLSSVKTYSYTLTCNNSSGSGYSTVSVVVSAASGGGGSAVAPSVTLSASPTTITSGGSTTLSWSINGNASQPVTCNSSWGGSKPTSGSQALSPTSTTSYTLTCTNSAGSNAKTVSVTVNPPAATCSPGGVCHLSDVQQHASVGNCWMALSDASHMKVYVISNSFDSQHNSTQGKHSQTTSKTCGKAITYNTLRGYASQHSGSQTIGGSTFETWLNSFYYAQYQ